MDKNIVRLHGPIELASIEISCWKCCTTTTVHALLAADVEEFEAGEESTRIEAESFVYDLSPDSLPPAVKVLVGIRAPNYKPTYSRAVDATSWANVCVHCGMLQGAFFLHCEPDGPFFGSPEEFRGARAIIVEQGFDVDWASYSL
jgi:hypothetical protein